MNTDQLIQQYLAGPPALRQAVDGLSAEDLDAIPIPETWSIRQVVCHIADAEILYADRIRRIITENEPTMMSADPETYLTALGVKNRSVENELKLVESIRIHIGQILAELQRDQFERKGIHSEDGPLTLSTVLERVTTHIPHHLKFIEEKKEKLAAS